MLRSSIPALVLLTATLSAHADPAPEKTDVFVKGEGGYHTYRIPALVVTTKGTLLAFCAGRKNNGANAGDINLFLRNSTDGGQTSDKVQTVWNEADNTGDNDLDVAARPTHTVTPPWRVLPLRRPGPSSGAWR
jgi:sialidase-1